LAHQVSELAQAWFDQIHPGFEGGLQGRPGGINNELPAGLLQPLRDEPVELIGDTGRSSEVKASRQARHSGSVSCRPGRTNR
jgi:hypothetical protein